MFQSINCGDTTNAIIIVDTDFTIEFVSKFSTFVEDIIYIYEAKNLDVAKNLFLYFITNYDDDNRMKYIKQFCYIKKYKQYSLKVKEYMLNYLLWC